MKAKATTLIVSRRLEDIIRIRLDGAEFWDVREFVREMEKEPGSAWELKPGERPMSTPQLWRYIGKASKVLKITNERNRGRILSMGIAKRHHLYAKAVLSGDIRTALGVLSDLAKLQGLYPDKKLVVQNERKTGDVVDMTDAELLEIAAGRTVD